MCDYSLHALRNRLASEGERLVVHRFYTGSIGMAPEAEVPAEANKPGLWGNFFRHDQPVCAVCIPPGATLRIHQIPERLQREFNVGETETVTFTEVTASEYAYRDAIRFHSGATVLLQRLQPGQTVDVLDLSNAKEERREPAFDELVA